MIYDIITNKFHPPHEFHVEFPSLAEFAIISGYLQVLVKITRRGHFLRLHGEYDFIEHMLVVKLYSYILLDKGKQAVIRADPLPHHRADYKGHNLLHFPNHLHDEKGRICSFSGKIEDFVKRASRTIASEGQG
jgi:hypothetical protein